MNRKMIVALILLSLVSPLLVAHLGSTYVDKRMENTFDLKLCEGRLRSSCFAAV